MYCVFDSTLKWKQHCWAPLVYLCAIVMFLSIVFCCCFMLNNYKCVLLTHDDPPNRNTTSRTPGQWGGGSADPPKIWSWGQKLHMALMLDRCQSNSTNFLPYVAKTISTISRAGVKINVSCYMIKLEFWPWPPVEKWFPRTCMFCGVLNI